MRRLRLAIIHEFNWEGPELTEDTADDLIRNFLLDPAGFLAMDSLEVDERILLDVEDITDVDS